MSPKQCVACGVAPANHMHQWIQGLLSEWSTDFLRLTGHVDIGRTRLWQLPYQWWWRFFVRLLVLVGISKFNDDLSDHPNLRSRCLWEGAQNLGIRMREIQTLGYRGNVFLAEYDGEEIFFEGLPRRIGSTTALGWMDDKEEMRRRFIEAGFPVAKGGLAKHLRDALAIFQTLAKPVIVKPRSGSRSRHTTIHVTTQEEFTRAFVSAKQISRWVVVEEEIPGAVHRVLVIGGIFKAVCRRDYPEVTGDGVHTIAQLVEEENKNPLRHGPIYPHTNVHDQSSMIVSRCDLESPATHPHHIGVGVYHTLPRCDDADANAALRQQGMDWNTIPPEQTIVRIGSKVNRGGGGAITELTPVIHPATKKLCEDVAKLVDDPIIGIDIILDDITRHWRDQPCGIIELNSLPFIDLHAFPLIGTPVYVAEDIWRLALPRVGSAPVVLP